MDPREESKRQNREKIKMAAERIIRQEGMEKLTMRHLAEEAEVSLRTPYNLFGSKTEILISLMDEVAWGFGDITGGSSSRPVLERLLQLIDRMERVYASDETFYRDIYWAIMSSDQPDSRIRNTERLIALSQAAIADAIAANELDEAVDAEDFGRHLMIQLLAVLGMWASGYFDNKDSARQIKLGWCASLLAHATRKSKPFLQERLSALSSNRKRKAAQRSAV